MERIRNWRRSLSPRYLSFISQLEFKHQPTVTDREEASIIRSIHQSRLLIVIVCPSIIGSRNTKLSSSTFITAYSNDHNFSHHLRAYLTSTIKPPINRQNVHVVIRYPKSVQILSCRNTCPSSFALYTNTSLTPAIEIGVVFCSGGGFFLIGGVMLFFDRAMLAMGNVLPPSLLPYPHPIESV